MLETGIGRAHNIALSTKENFSLPGDVSASKRYWKEDIIDPEVQVSATGHDRHQRPARYWLPGEVGFDREAYGEKRNTAEMNLG